MTTTTSLRRVTGPRLVLFGLAAIALAAQAGAPPAPAATQGTPEQGRRKLEVDEDGLVRNIWWNNEQVVAALGLAVEQRAKMDQLFRAFLTSNRARQEAVRTSFDRYYVDLAAGRFVEARKRLEQVRESTRNEASSQPGLKIDVLSLLTPEQFTRFQASYPHLFEQPWYRNLMFGRGGVPEELRAKRTMGSRPAGGPLAQERPAPPAAKPPNRPR